MSRVICRLSSRRKEAQDVAAAFGLALSDRDDEFDLHRYAAGQRAHADRRARVTATVAEHLDDVLDAIEIAAQRISYRRDQHQADLPRVAIPLFDRHAGAELASRRLAVGPVGWALAGEIEEITGPLGVDIV